MEIWMKEKLKSFKKKWQKEVKGVQKNGGRYSSEFRKAVFELGKNLPYKAISDTMGIAPSVFYRWFPGHNAKVAPKKEGKEGKEVEKVLTKKEMEWEFKIRGAKIVNLENKLQEIASRLTKTDIVDGIRALLDGEDWNEKEVEACLVYCKLLIDKTIDFANGEIDAEEFDRNF